MEQEIITNYDDDEIRLIPPYWWVEYLDDAGYKHLAIVINELDLKCLQDRYDIIQIRLIEA